MIGPGAQRIRSRLQGQGPRLLSALAAGRQPRRSIPAPRARCTAGPSARGCQAGVMRQVHPSDPGAPPVDHNPQKISGCCRTASTCQREAGGCCRGRGGRCVAWFSCLSWRSRGWCPGGSICHREVPPHITPTGSPSSPRPHAPGHLPKPSHGGLYTNSHQKQPNQSTGVPHTHTGAISGVSVHVSARL